MLYFCVFFSLPWLRSSEPTTFPINIKVDKKSVQVIPPTFQPKNDSVDSKNMDKGQSFMIREKVINNPYILDFRTRNSKVHQGANEVS